MYTVEANIPLISLRGGRSWISPNIYSAIDNLVELFDNHELIIDMKEIPGYQARVQGEHFITGSYYGFISTMPDWSMVIHPQYIN